MITLGTISRALSNPEQLVNNAVAKAMEQESVAMVELQKAQMLKGIAKDGAPIGKYRSGIYAIQKYKQSQAAGLGQVDLRLSGSFYSGVFLKVNNFQFEFNSHDSKTELLRTKYRDRFFGIAPQNQGQLIDIIQNPTVAIIAAKTGLSIVRG